MATLPETNSSHLKMDRWFRWCSFWEGYFQGRLLLVLGRVSFILILHSKLALADDSYRKPKKNDRNVDRRAAAKTNANHRMFILTFNVCFMSCIYRYIWYSWYAHDILLMVFMTAAKTWFYKSKNHHWIIPELSPTSYHRTIISIQKTLP